MNTHATSALFGISHLPGIPENDYCGPAALSALTGLSCEFMAQCILDGRDNNRQVKSACLREVVDLLHGLGCETTEIKKARGITLSMFDKTLVEDIQSPVLIYLSNHFIVCDPYEATYYDNHVDGPKWIDEFPSPRRRIKHAYTVNRNFDISELQEMEKDWILDNDLLD